MLHNHDSKRLTIEFATAFDAARAQHLLDQSDSHLSGAFPVVGEGTHFKAWRLRSGGNPAFELVLKRAHSSFLTPDMPRYRHWVDGISRLRLVKSPLIPPYAVITTDKYCGLVMPYGPDPLVKAAPIWQPIDTHLQNMTSSLSVEGLCLDDTIQCRVWQGIPFLIDFSDIRILSL